MALNAWLLLKSLFLTGASDRRWGRRTLLARLHCLYCLLLARSMYTLSFVLSLCSQCYIMLLSTLSLSTVGQQMLVQEGHVFAAKLKKTCLRGRKEIFLHLDVRKYSVCMERLHPSRPPSFFLLAWLLQALEFTAPISGPHSPQRNHAFQKQSAFMYIILLKPHNDLVKWAESRLSPSFTQWRSSDKSSDFPNITQEANVRTKPRSQHKVQIAWFRGKTKARVAQKGKNFRFVPHFRIWEWLQWSPHDAELILSSWLFFFFIPVPFPG